MEKIINNLFKIIFILSILILIYVIFFVKKVETLEELMNSDYEESEYLGEIPYAENTNQITKVWVSNMNDLFGRYTGELSRSTVSTFIRNIVLVQIYDLKEQNITKQYFDDNIETIVKTYGISSYEELSTFYEYVRDYEENVVEINIIGESVVVGEDNTIFDIEVLFESGNKKEFRFTIRQYKSINNIKEPNIVLGVK